MNKYKNLLIGSNAIDIGWIKTVKSINKENIVVINFDDAVNVKDTILNKNIDYILPLSDKDNNLLTSHNLHLCDKVKIIYPTYPTIKLLNNKNLFTEFMLVNYSNYIPDIYYLNNIKLKDIEYPAFYKPTYSTNGANMSIIYNENDFLKLNNHNNIQQFIDDEYEYAAFMLCISGKIINTKIVRHKYKKYNIKTRNFPNTYETVMNVDINVFETIIKHLDYSGGMCINFKMNELTNKLYIFEINPRFGGSAFTCNFIYELLCFE
jgi:carbamoylphosphate synthase large subunit